MNFMAESNWEFSVSNWEKKRYFLALGMGPYFGPKLSVKGTLAVELNLRETQREDFLFKFESVASGLFYALHCKRTRYLNDLKKTILNIGGVQVKSLK